MKEKVGESVGCTIAILFVGFGLLQLGAAWVGLEDTFGRGWAVAAIAVALMFRFTLPVVVGAFLCAKNTWDWHWALALIFAAPGLLFMVPALFGGAVDAIRRM